MVESGGPVVGDTVLAGTSGIRAPAEVFNSIFVVFLGLGTLVGVVVISYTLYNAYKYRYREGEDPAPDVDRPELGELPEGGGKGKKLFLSFGISALIVLSLVIWTYASLLYVEGKPTEVQQTGGEVMNVEVDGFRFGWQFTYPNGAQASTLRVPTDTVINLSVTSRDVFHNFGIPELRAKADAIPGQTTNTWFVANETGTYQANCYEICGEGHSGMTAEVVAMEPAAFEEWYANAEPSGNETAGTDTAAGNETATAGGGGHSLAPQGPSALDASSAPARGGAP
ncbi:cytochrome c oxidase subunit II [Halosimplex aquaticum]|uniref:cytochrome-c oxidase n=1 Tax=Halosimplex aquaticum TaxID=3026162 RepID=A0ABD5Y3J1_9EURY|nr:cytochrome c oxidase subunit II [Halosimplex aquaticum]